MLFVDLLDKYAVLFVTTVSPLLCHWNVFFHWRGPWAGQTIERMVLCIFPCFMPVTLFFSVFVFLFLFLFSFLFLFERERERMVLCSFPQKSMSWLCCCHFNPWPSSGSPLLYQLNQLSGGLYALLWLLISS